MRTAKVYRNQNLAGILTEESRNSYVFRYDDAYYRDASMPPVSLTMPKTRQTYQSEQLFPFFSNMVAEGENRKVQSRLLNVDEQDLFGLLLATGSADTIGNITIQKLPSP